MTRYSKLVLAAIVVCAAGAALPAAFGLSDAQAQMAQSPAGHRQPRAGEVPTDSSQKPRSPEDIALERALANICRGCSPIIPVRTVPRYNVVVSCPAGQGNENCRKDEDIARGRLNDQWTQFTEKARSDCVQANEIGGRPSYVQLGICLKATQLAPTLPEGQ
jgi:hypothetical protein